MRRNGQGLFTGAHETFKIRYGVLAVGVLCNGKQRKKGACLCLILKVPKLDKALFFFIPHVPAPVLFYALFSNSLSRPPNISCICLLTHLGVCR